MLLVLTKEKFIQKINFQKLPFISLANSFNQFSTTSPSVILQNTRRDISTKMKRSMHTTVLWIASKNLSTVLGKLYEFSTVNTDFDDDKNKINLDPIFHLNFAHFCSSQWGPPHCEVVDDCTQVDNVQ